MTINGINSKALPSGIYVPVVTFFQAAPDQDLDIQTHVRHIRMLAEAGVDGVVVQGSTGEAVALSHQERIEVHYWARDKLGANRQLIRTAKETFTQAGNSGLIIAGTVGAQSSVENVLMCQEAAAAGADFALVLPPSYYPSFMTDEVIEAFYVQLADASPIPIIIYSYPGVCAGINMSSDVIIRVGQHPNVAGVKHTDHDIGKIARECRAEYATPFTVLGGATDYLLGALAVGGRGSITGMGNIAPRVCCKALELGMNGDQAEASRFAGVISDAEVSLGRGGVIGTKYATISANSYPETAGACRHPLPSVSQITKEDVDQRCAEIILLEQQLVKEGYTGKGLQGLGV